MKKAALAVVLTIIFLTGCGAPQNLVNMTSYSPSGEGASIVIEWNGVEYYWFGSNVEPLMGKQIGIVDGNESDRVYAVRGYSNDEWIIEKLHTGEMDVAMLYKEKFVENIPAELEKYKPEPDTRFETIARIVESGDRVIIANGDSWNFTLDMNKTLPDLSIRGLAGGVTNDILPTDMSIGNLVKLYFGADITQYNGYAIDVLTYYTVHVGIEENMRMPEGVRKTHLFVFAGNNLIFEKQLENEEQFETVKSICYEMARIR